MFKKLFKKLFKKQPLSSGDARIKPRSPGNPVQEKRSHKLPMSDFVAGMDFPYTRAIPRYTNLAFANTSPTQKLDLYLPQGPGPFPLVLLVHGGGFGMGDKAHMVSKAGTDILLENGYAVAGVNYRLSMEAKVPAQIHDVKTAVRWLRAHAGKYDLDPDKFAVWGASAGANMAALLGTSCGVDALEGVYLGYGETSSRVQAVVDWFGPVDFLAMDEQFSGKPDLQTHNAPDSPESLVLGVPIQTRPDLVQLCNPITYISPDACPFLIQHGVEDNLVPVQQSQMLYDALLPVIGADKVTLTLLEGASHGGPQFWSVDNIEEVLNFLDRFLK